MELLSLPDEMLASIFKYNLYNTNVIIRKLNRRSNSVIKSYIGTRLPIDTLFWRKSVDKTLCMLCPEDEPEQFSSLRLKGSNFYVEHLEHIPVATALQELLKRNITVVGTLELIIPQFDDAILDALYNNIESTRFTTSLRITATILCSFNKLDKLIANLKKMERLRVNDNIDVFCDAKLLRGRKWSSIVLDHSEYLDHQHEHHQLNDQFLSEVVENCEDFFVFCNCRTSIKFSIPAILRTFQAALKKGIFPRWGFMYVQPGKLTMSEIKSLVHEIPNIEADFNNERRSCVIKMPGLISEQMWFRMSG